MKTDSLCRDDRLRLLLREDEQSGDYHDAARHVDSCPHCQQRIGELAAEDDEWHEAHEMLLAGDESGSGISDSVSGHELSRGRWQRRPTAWSEAMAWQLLSPPSHPEMLGRIGRYEVERLIGTGGMGVVFKAFDSELNRPVAVKLLAPYLAGSGAARKRFAREARAAAAVVHEHVVAIHNVETDGEVPFLVMQYVPGESLQCRLDREGALDVCEILRIGMQTASGLAAAHAQGLVHRDVKPPNVLLEKGVERSLLTDFGLARASDDASLTRTGHHLGTPQYMSPEQARGEVVDVRSDLFSLGSVMYAMCTGRPPFRAESSYGVLRRITDSEPRPIREINPNIPDWLERLIQKLHAKSLVDRFQTADEVAELLKQCLAHVQQPTSVPLPASLIPHAIGRRSIFNVTRKGVLAMLGTIGMTLLGMVLLQATEAPDIAGLWTSEEWGTVVLEAKQPGQYEGTFTGSNKNAVRSSDRPVSGTDQLPDSIKIEVPALGPNPTDKDKSGNTFNFHVGFDRQSADKDKSGTVHLKWSRVERRFNGTWGKKNDRSGKISLRLVGHEVRGGWTTDKDAQKESGTPRLGDLLWTRRQQTTDKAAVEVIDPKSLTAAAARFNADTAEVRNKLFAPPIPDLTVEQLREGFRQSASLYRRQGKRQVADALEKIAESGQLPQEASELIGSGTHAPDENGGTISRQVVPAFVLPDDTTSTGNLLVVLRPLELIYRKEGPISKDYGDQFQPEQDELEGVWEQVLPPDEEAKIPEEGRYRMVFAGDWFATFQGSNRISASRFTVEPQHTPKRIANINLGSGDGLEFDVPVPARGIYEIKDGRVRFNFVRDTDALPTKFGIEHPEFKRVKGKLAEEQLAALKRYSTKAATTKHTTPEPTVPGTLSDSPESSKTRPQLLDRETVKDVPVDWSFNNPGTLTKTQPHESRIPVRAKLLVVKRDWSNAGDKKPQDGIRKALSELPDTPVSRAARVQLAKAGSLGPDDLVSSLGLPSVFGAEDFANLQSWLRDQGLLLGELPVEQKAEPRADERWTSRIDLSAADVAGLTGKWSMSAEMRPASTRPDDQGIFRVVNHPYYLAIINISRTQQVMEREPGGPHLRGAALRKTPKFSFYLPKKRVVAIDWDALFTGKAAQPNEALGFKVILVVEDAEVPEPRSTVAGFRLPERIGSLYLVDEGRWLSPPGDLAEIVRGVATARPEPAGQTEVSGIDSDSRIAPLKATGKQLGTVLGKPIHEGNLNKNVSTEDNLKRLLFQPLTENYCRQHKLDRAEELQTKIKDEKRRAMARLFVLPAELNRHLFEKHGGRVILSPFGAVAFDGLKKWLEEREQAGEFEITDPELRAKYRELWMQVPAGARFASPDQIKAAFDPDQTDRFIENFGRKPATVETEGKNEPELLPKPKPQDKLPDEKANDSQSEAPSENGQTNFAIGQISYTLPFSFPSVESILRHLPEGKARPKNEQIQCELVKYQVSNARHYPLVGPAQLVQAHFKSTFTSDAGREVVYSDSTHLSRVPIECASMP